MADSLRLRETATDAGLRSTSGEAALRQDGFTPTTALSTNIFSRVSSSVVDYDPETKEWTVKVIWRSPTAPTLSTPAAGSLNIREAQIRYSWEGYPEFWTDGEYLNSHSPTNTMPSPVIHSGIVTTRHVSNWLYYSLLHKYTDSSGNIYTERVAWSSVLIPTYHDIGSSLWNRMPAYYRQQDTTGHLEKFLRVFGWEADQCRSVIEEIMHLKDPQRVHYGSIDRLADSMGLRFNTEELRPHQIRELLMESQRYFSQRGRADTLLSLLGLVTDSEVSYRDFRVTSTTAAAEPYSRIKFTTTANRLNLIKDPRLNGAPGTASASMWHYLASASSGSITVSNTSAGTDGLSLSTNASSAGTVYIFPTTPVQIKRSISYYTSVSASLTSASAQVRLYREKPTSTVTLPDQSRYFHTDDATYVNYYKNLTLNNAGDAYSSGAFEQRNGYDVESSNADAHAVYLSTVSTVVTNGVLFRARLYASTTTTLSGYSLKLTRVDANPSGSGRFDRFNIAVHDGTANVIDPQTSSSDTNFTINTAGELINEDTSAVVTKLTSTTGGVDYTLLIDSVANISYASTTQLPSDDTSTYQFIDTGVEHLYPVIIVTLGNSASVTLDKWIFQPFSDGPYFDGTVLDGHSYLSGGSVVSDYYWSGTANSSVSLFTPIRRKTRAAIRKVIANNIPLTVSTELTTGTYYTSTVHGHLVTFDATPGDERAFDPHAWNANVYSEGTIRSLSD